MKEPDRKPPVPKPPRSGAAADDIAGFMPGHEVEEEDSGEEIVVATGPDVAFTKIEWDNSARDTDGKTGADVIQEFVKRLPNAPGVYRMMNAAGDVLYVGKARSLKKRVAGYAQGRFHTDRIGRMVRETTTMEFVVTRTETEALLLEANLIKRLRPRFNVLMRDDKSFPLHPAHHRPPLARHLQASRRALAQGRVFRTVRLGAGGRAHDQFAAAGVPASDLHGLGVREPHPALPALPDQALLRSVHRRDQRPTTMACWSERRAISCPARARR